MDYEALLNEILNVGSYMLQSGAEASRVEDSVYRMCSSYEEVEFTDIYAIQSNLQATIQTKDHKHYTQIRRIYNSSYNFDRVDYLNDLSRTICAEQPEPEQIHEMFVEVLRRKQPAPYMAYVAALLGECGFGVSMGCGFKDLLVLSVVTVFILVGFGNWLAKRENNMFVYNLIVCCLASSFVAVLERMGMQLHVDRLIPTIIFYLISGLGITVGIRDLINKDTISGILNLVNSVVGSVAIACGVGLGLTIAGDVLEISSSEAPNVVIQVVAVSVGCLGFALSYKAAIEQCISAVIGGLLTYICYLLAIQWGASAFFATVTAATVTGISAFVLSRIHRAPGTIFLTISALPLIPGVHLFNGMYAVVNKDSGLAKTEFFKLVTLCFAIQLGFIIIDIAARYLVRILPTPTWHFNKQS